MKIFLFSLFLSMVLVHASNECLTASCHKDGPIIRFPFWLQKTTQQQQQKSCAPSGFNLSCNGQNYPILHIPGSGDFYLTSVDYYRREVILQDVEGCLPTRLLSLDLSSTPLEAILFRYYTFFSCSRGKLDPSSRGYARVVECTSNETSDVFATGDDVAEGLNFSVCSKIATVPVPVSFIYPFFSVGLDLELTLTWDARDCPKGLNFSPTAIILALQIHAMNRINELFVKWLSISRHCPVCRISLPIANSC